jgi:hypothetical protein
MQTQKVLSFNFIRGENTFLSISASFLGIPAIFSEKEKHGIVMILWEIMPVLLLPFCAVYFNRFSTEISVEVTIDTRKGK